MIWNIYLLFEKNKSLHLTPGWRLTDFWLRAACQTAVCLLWRWLKNALLSLSCTTFQWPSDHKSRNLIFTCYNLLNKEQKKENGASPLAGPWTACVPVPDSKADVTTTEVWRILEYVTPWLRFCCCSWNFLRVIFLVIDVLLSVATGMAVDRLVHNSVQFVTS